MIEVLITLVILLFALLGLVGLQSRAQLVESDSYQRAQALILVHDIADRLNANRSNAAGYVVAVGSPLGQGSTKDCSAPASLADRDLCAWDAALKGAAEALGGACAADGTHCVGAMIGARGCITSPAANQYLIEVVWQGLAKTVAPPASVGCGANLYPDTTTPDDTVRRAVTTAVTIGTLSP